jgi:hypothetical protein
MDIKNTFSQSGLDTNFGVREKEAWGLKSDQGSEKLFWRDKPQPGKKSSS